MATAGKLTPSCFVILMRTPWSDEELNGVRQIKEGRLERHHKRVKEKEVRSDDDYERASKSGSW